MGRCTTATMVWRRILTNPSTLPASSTEEPLLLTGISTKEPSLSELVDLSAPGGSHFTLFLCVCKPSKVKPFSLSWQCRKTALMLALCEFLRDNYSLAAVSFSAFSSSNFVLHFDLSLIHI